MNRFLFPEVAAPVISAILLALGMAGCTSHSSGPSVLANDKSSKSGQLSSQIPEIRFDQTVSSDLKQLVESDFKTLEAMTFSNADPEVAKIMGLKEVSGVSLSMWFHERIHYILGDSYNEDSLVTIESANFNYSPQIVSSSGLTIFSRFFSNGYAETLPDGFRIAALNLAAGVYGYGKRNNKLMAFTINSSEKVLVKSPRVGALRVTSNLMSDHFLVDPEHIHSLANLAARLPVLFHEARHSDGNGENVGFMHSVCADGLYAGDRACDNSLNGPYEIQRVLHKLLMNSCTECTSAQTAKLQSLVDDAASRTLPGSTVVNSDAEHVN